MLSLSFQVFIYLGYLPNVWSTSCLQNKDNRSLNDKLSSLENSYTTESERLRGELSRLRGVEEEAKNKSNQVSSLQEELERLRRELSTTQQEKKTIEDWAQTYRDEMEKVSQKPRATSRFFWSPGLLDFNPYCTHVMMYI